MSRGEKTPRNQKCSDNPGSAAPDVLSLARPISMWQHGGMIEFRALTDDHPHLVHSPLLRAAQLTLRYTQEHGAIGLTKTAAFNHGTIERTLFVAFSGQKHDRDNAGWREMAAFSSCVLRPLEWARLLVQTLEERDGKHIQRAFKTPLWRRALKLGTDNLLRPLTVQQT